MIQMIVVARIAASECAPFGLSMLPPHRDRRLDWQIRVAAASDESDESDSESESESVFKSFKRLREVRSSD